MRLSRNLLAGLTNSIWSALVGLAVVPFYIKYLGIEAYGLIGFFATTQALLQLLDLGLAPTINREVARCSASGNMREARNLLHSLAIIYCGMAILIASLVAVAAPFIAQYWLQSKSLSIETITHAVMLMGLIVGCRWPIGLYMGALMGAQRLNVSSGISIVMVTLGNFGAVGVLAFVSPSIEVFFLWQAFVGLVYAVVMRWGAWRVLGSANDVQFDMEGLKRIWRFSAGVTGIALSAVILMQLDKVLLSKILSLEDFGRYTLAALVASGLYVVLTPVFNVIYPRMSALITTGEIDKLIQFYRLGTRMLLAVLFPLATVAIVFSEDLIFLWTGNPELSSHVAPVVSLFLVGTALNGAMHFPYALQLAYGMTRLPLMINGILIIGLIPLTIFLALRYGAIGGASSWAILNGLYLFVGTWLTHRVLLKGTGSKWLLRDVGIPLGISLVVVGLGGKLVHEWDYPHYLSCVLGIGLAFLASAITILSSSDLSSIVRINLSRKHQ